MPRAVLDMMDRRPIWAMPAWVPDEIRDALPSGWDLVVNDEETDGSGDGAARVAPRVLDAVAEAEVYFGYGIPAQLVDAAPRLAWVHSGAAGVGSSLTPSLIDRDIVFTNSAGIHADPMAETVLGMLLFFGRGLHLAVQNQRAPEWNTEPYYEAGAPLSELGASTVGIVGCGGVGKGVARRVASLGAKVIALKRTEPKPSDKKLASMAGGALDADVELVHGEAGLAYLLSRSDAVVLTVPETDQTRGMIDEGALSRMKAGAVLINVARGKVVDEDALIRALQSGHLRGAGLDVFSKEPLVAGSPLWGLPNVLVTPHVSAVTRGFWRREADLMLHNLRCYLSGAEPSQWRCVVDQDAGY